MGNLMKKSMIVLCLFPVMAQQNRPISAGASGPTMDVMLAVRKYSPLAQIDASNVARLKEAWTWDLPEHEARKNDPANLETVPTNPRP